MPRRIVVMWALLALAAAPTSLSAQRLFSVALGGGASFPQGSLSEGANPGWNALASILLGTPMQPLGLQADVAYNQFGFEGADGHESVGSATLNASYRIPTPGTPLSPYLISGLGAYRTDCSIDCDAITHFGWNVGLGTKLYFLGFRSFLEARYHRTSAGGSSVNYFPVTFGVRF